MPGESAPLAPVTKPAMALVDFVKKYWIAGPFILLGFIAFGMAIKPWFTKATTTLTPTGTIATIQGDKLPAFLRALLRVGTTVAIGYCLLSPGDAFAAVVGASSQLPAYSWIHAHGWIGQALSALAALGLGNLAFGIVGRFSSPQTLDCKTSNDGRVLNYVPGAFQEVSLYIKPPKSKLKSTKGAPLVATDITLAMDTTVEQTTGGSNPIMAQDLARLLSYMEIESPFYGMILDKKTGTGPMIDLVINFVGQGFGRSGDAPLETITVPDESADDEVLTKYFTFPFQQRILEDSSACCPWVGSLTNTELRIGIAASTALAAVSTAANTKGASTLRAGVGIAANPYWRLPYLPYARLDTPASGTDGLTFQNFGGTGPSSSKAIDMVHTIGQLSSLAGLPGNLTFDTLTNIVAPDFDLDDVKNIDLLVKNRLDSQFENRIGAYDYATGGNHRQGAGNHGMALDQLLFLFLRQASLHMQIQRLPKYDSETRLTLREDGIDERTGKDAFIVLGYRELSPAKMQELSVASGGQIPADYTKARTFTPTR